MKTKQNLRHRVAWHYLITACGVGIMLGYMLGLVHQLAQQHQRQHDAQRLEVQP